MYTNMFSGLPEEGDDFFDGPDMVGEARLHRGRHAERLVNLYEVVVPEV
jgi:hypothetical protein